jgi:NADPH:quinone reductase-like Zn-dependent oxidoreductase
MGRRSELLDVLEFVKRGLIRPVVDTVLPLAEARAAHDRLESGRHFGKIVLVP